jgi:hypothetical protein
VLVLEFPLVPGGGPRSGTEDEHEDDDEHEHDFRRRMADIREAQVFADGGVAMKLRGGR